MVVGHERSDSIMQTRRAGVSRASVCGHHMQSKLNVGNVWVYAKFFLKSKPRAPRVSYKREACIREPHTILGQLKLHICKSTRVGATSGLPWTDRASTTTGGQQHIQKFYSLSISLEDHRSTRCATPTSPPRNHTWWVYRRVPAPYRSIINGWHGL